MDDDGVHWDYSKNSNNMFAGGSMLVSSKVGLAVGIITVVVAILCGWWWHYVLLKESKARTSSNKKAPLPPGSLGLPLLGETLEFLHLTQANRSAEFLNPCVAKYGQVQPLNPSLFLLFSTLPSSPAFNSDFCLKSQETPCVAFNSRSLDLSPKIFFFPFSNLSIFFFRIQSKFADLGFLSFQPIHSFLINQSL
jgi:hypothetical protein